MSATLNLSVRAIRTTSSTSRRSMPTRCIADPRLGKRDRGLVRGFLVAATGISRPQMEGLDLAGNAVADASPLGDVARLLWLDLSGNRLAATNGHGRLTRLRWVWLHGNPHPDVAITVPWPDGVWLDAGTGPSGRSGRAWNDECSGPVAALPSDE